MHISLWFVLAFHVPSAEMLFPQMSMWLIALLSESLLKCHISGSSALPILLKTADSALNKNIHLALLMPQLCSAFFP